MTFSWDYPDLPRMLQEQMRRGRADRHWRRALSPQLTYGRHAGPARSDARRAAVAIVLYRQEDRWCVPLTVRPAGLRTHGGQVSFPGGAIEPGEIGQEAAQRELVEELFADRSPSEVNIEWLAPLEPLLVFVSNVLVEPWLGVLGEAAIWNPAPVEVERVLTLPLDRLMREEPDTMAIRRGSLTFTAPRWSVEGEDVWGTTAVLLGELRGWLQRLVPMRPSDG